MLRLHPASSPPFALVLTLNVYLPSLQTVYVAVGGGPGSVNVFLLQPIAIEITAINSIISAFALAVT